MKYHDDILIYATQSVLDRQKQLMLLKHEKAAFPPGRSRKSLPCPAEDRIFHKESLVKFEHSADTLHTHETQFFHSHPMRAEKTNQVQSKTNGIGRKTNLPNLPS